MTTTHSWRTQMTAAHVLYNFASIQTSAGRSATLHTPRTSFFMQENCCAHKPVLQSLSAKTTIDFGATVQKNTWEPASVLAYLECFLASSKSERPLRKKIRHLSYSDFSAPYSLCKIYSSDSSFPCFPSEWLRLVSQHLYLHFETHVSTRTSCVNMTPFSFVSYLQ